MPGARTQARLPTLTWRGARWHRCSTCSKRWTCSRACIETGFSQTTSTPASGRWCWSGFRVPRPSSLQFRVLGGRAPSHPTESDDSAGTPREALKPASPPARARSAAPHDDAGAPAGLRSLACSSAPWLRPPMPRNLRRTSAASHNPSLFNGIKFKTATGSSASPDVIAELEPRINALDSVPVPDRSASGEMVSVYDPRAPYYAQIGRMVDLNAIKSAGLHIVHECMHGSGYGYIKELLEGGRTDVVELHSDRNPLFGGVNPQPTPPNIDSSIAYMRGGGHDLCICTDGDADRVGIIDETGRFINQLHVFALLRLYLFDIRHMVCPVVMTVIMTSMVDKLGAEFGVPVYEVPVGFKNVAPKMIETEAVLGGEESGGFAIKGHIPERDR